MELSNKVAIVTGGGSGIGAALAQRFVREGASNVVVADIHAALAVAGALGPRALAVRCDVSKEGGHPIAGETFMALPHPEVAIYFRNKAQDYDCWLGGMQKVYARQTGG